MNKDGDPVLQSPNKYENLTIHHEQGTVTSIKNKLGDKHKLNCECDPVVQNPNTHKNLTLYSGLGAVLGPAGEEFEKLHASIFSKNKGKSRHVCYPETSNKQNLASVTSMAAGSFTITLTSDVSKDGDSQKTRKKHPRITTIHDGNKSKIDYSTVNREQTFSEIIDNSLITLTGDPLNLQKASVAGGSFKKTFTSDASTDKGSQETRKKHPRIVWSCNKIEEYPNDKKSSAASLSRAWKPQLCVLDYRSGTRKPQFPNSAFSDTPHRIRKYESLITHSTDAVMPCYKNYQLLGDSQLLRFSEQVLDFKRSVSCTVTGENKKTCGLGYCVSGQRIQDLKHRLSQNEYKLSKNVVMLIGTNDILHDTPIAAIIEGYKSIVSILQMETNRIILLTVPPVPKFKSCLTVAYKLETLNKCVKNCADDRKVFVLDLASQYIYPKNVIALEYYEKMYDNDESRVDLVHLNRKGLEKLKALLDMHLD